MLAGFAGAERFTVVHVTEPRQVNSHDCGVHALATAAELCALHANRRSGEQPLSQAEVEQAAKRAATNRVPTFRADLLTLIEERRAH